MLILLYVHYIYVNLSDHLDKGSKFSEKYVNKTCILYMQFYINFL